MKIFTRTLIIILAIYTITLLAIEYKTSQEYVRNYFTDIHGPVFFYAVNTTLSVSLFFATSLIFLISIFTLEGDFKRTKEFYFIIIQVFLFFYLGMDDRFMFHEKELYKLGIDGDYILAIMAVGEFILLLTIGELRKKNKTILIYLLLSGFFAFIMFIVDLFFPSHMLLRLSSEDLSKTWAAFFFFIFAFSLLIEKINYLKKNKLNKA